MAFERMTEFFTVRADGYDRHMLSNVEGCPEAYAKIAELLPFSLTNLLDLGCGTGLELEEIFNRYPRLTVTGIDLTQAMLDKLQEKYADKALTLICKSYFDTDFGTEVFDAVISVQTLHHFTHAAKERLYAKIRNALKPGGAYIECDYMVVNQSDEDYFVAENKRICRAYQTQRRGDTQ